MRSSFLFVLMSLLLIPHNFLVKGQATTCLGKLNTASGSITFMIATPITRNKRCAWIIRVPGMSSFEISYASANAQSALDSQVTVTGFGINQAPKEMVLVHGMNNVPFTDRSVVVVTYHTVNDPNPASKGFTLTYQARGAGDSTPPSTESKDVLFGSSQVSGYTDHPPTGEYSAGEFSTFLFALPNNEFVATRKVDTVFIIKHLETPCEDSITLYDYTPRPANVWTPSGSLCGNQSAAHFSKTELSLAVFESDSSIQGEGFGVLHKSCT